jgi:dynein heavy chain
MINAHLKKYNGENHVLMASNFSSTTTPQLFQKQVEANVDKRMGSTYGPPTGKTMTLFIDDVNLPSYNEWADQVSNGTITLDEIGN